MAGLFAQYKRSHCEAQDGKGARFRRRRRSRHCRPDSHIGHSGQKPRTLAGYGEPGEVLAAGGLKSFKCKARTTVRNREAAKQVAVQVRVHRNVYGPGSHGQIEPKEVV